MKKLAKLFALLICGISLLGFVSCMQDSDDDDDDLNAAVLLYVIGKQDNGSFQAANFEATTYTGDAQITVYGGSYAVIAGDDIGVYPITTTGNFATCSVSGTDYTFHRSGENVTYTLKDGTATKK